MDRGVVVGSAGIRAPTEQGKVRWHAQFGQALRQCALPRRPDDREVTALAADRAGARRMRHVVPRVDDLHHPEPLPHVRHRQDHRFLRQIQVRQRVERIDVEADHGPVRRVGKLPIVNELVDRGMAPGRPWTRAWPCRSGSRCRRAACQRSRPPARWPSLRRERWTAVGVGSWS